MPRAITKALQEAKEWPPDLDPVEFLSAYEIRAAEVYFQCQGNLPSIATASERLNFERSLYDQWPVVFSEAWTDTTRKRLLNNRAWVAYLALLKKDLPKQIMARLENQGLRAAENYLWAQETARKEKDYKETRLASADHLDRLGATRNHGNQNAPSLTIILKGRNFELESLDKELPKLLTEQVEVVVENPEIVD